MLSYSFPAFVYQDATGSLTMTRGWTAMPMLVRRVCTTRRLLVGLMLNLQDIDSKVLVIGVLESVEEAVDEAEDK